LSLPAETIANSVFEQVRALGEIAAGLGARLTHVKAHGALYNQATRDRVLAEAIVSGVSRWSRDVILVALAGSLMLDVFRQAGFRVAAEAFADRRYEPDGTLRSRKFQDALICNPAEAGEQALRIAKRGTAVARDGTQIAVSAQTICIHGDTPGAPKIAAAVMRTLKQAGVELSALEPQSGDHPVSRTPD
jgi:UPF0271 protein